MLKRPAFPRVAPAARRGVWPVVAWVLLMAPVACLLPSTAWAQAASAVPAQAASAAAPVRKIAQADAFVDPMDDPLASSGPIRIGVQRAAMPFAFEWKPRTEVFRGYSVDLCLRVLQLLRAEEGRPFDPAKDVRFVPVTPRTRMMQLLSGRIDMECGSTSNTAERRRMGIAFSSTIFVSDVAVLMTAEAAAQARTLGSWVNDMRAHRRPIVTTANTTAEPHLRELGRGNNEWRRLLTLAPRHEDSLDRLVAGKAQAFVMDRALLATWLAADKRLAGGRFVLSDWSLVPGRPECYGILTRVVNTRLSGGVNRVLGRLRESGEMSQIYARWFEQPLAPENRMLDLPAHRTLNLPMSPHLSRVIVSPGYEACP